MCIKYKNVIRNSVQLRNATSSSKLVIVTDSSLCDHQLTKELRIYCFIIKAFTYLDLFLQIILLVY